MKTYAIGRETMPREMRCSPPADAEGYYAIGNVLSGNGEPVWAYPTRASAIRAYKNFSSGLRLNLWRAEGGFWNKVEI